jgi:hypothetical protein
MMISSRILVIPAFLLILAASCKKIEQLPPVPRIEFRSFEVFDTTDILGNDAKGGRLKFYFEDGDGDMGLNPPSGPGQDSTNLFFDLWKRSGGVLVPAAGNDPLNPSDYRIPYMERLGQNKILKGTISVTFIYLFYSDADTIQYEFYIKDRLDNMSNIEKSCEIVLVNNGICNK